MRKRKIIVYTVVEASKIVNCCCETIRRACREGQLRHVKINRPNRIFISDYSLREWMNIKKEAISPELMKSVVERFESIEPIKPIENK